MRTWTVREVVPEQRFVWDTSARGLHMTAVHELTALDGGRTANVLRVELDGPLAGITAALIGRRLREVLVTENTCFARLATAPGPTVG